MPRVRKGDVVWVEPKLVCEVDFVEWTHDGHLRAPSYQGLREDKDPGEVRREEPMASDVRKGKRVLKLSNRDKPFWPEEGITKGDLLSYYRRIAPVVVPHLRDRPFTMKRYPDGWQGPHFFQKDAPKHMPDWIPTRSYRSTSRESRQKRTIAYPLVNDELALLWMVNMGCIDLNTWYSRVDKPDRPDWVLFDLDPSPDVGFRETIQVALLVKQALDALELESLVKTEWSKAKRRGVLIDSNQNGEGKTIASVYSVRPKAGAPVSTPLRWEEVKEDLDPAAFTMEAVLGRVERHGDLFDGVLNTKQSLGKALRALR